MAPALTEPLSTTENLTNSAAKTTTTPTTRSSRKLESISNKTGINNITTTITNNVLRSTQSIREKRNRSGCLTINQTPSSSKRITRSRDNKILSSTGSSPFLNEENIKATPQKITSIINNSKTTSFQKGDTTIINSINNNNSTTNNEQMGLSTDLLNNKITIPNNNNNQNLDKVNENTKDTSTAQLLADLTNEAITAEICLRNQLKDVNLVKTSRDTSSPIIQEETFVDTDIVVLKDVSSASAATSEINKRNTAHMEARFIESSKSSTIQDSTTSENIIPSATVEESLSIDEVKIKEKESVGETDHQIQYGEGEHQKVNQSASDSIETETIVDTTTLHGSPADSPKSSESIETKNRGSVSSKLEILSVQELPPVSTDSTMTASEVDDNLEERLSQLDGTAIDSPPSNNDIDPNEKNSHNTFAAATPPHTPIHQTLTDDLQELQQQLQDNLPTPIAQQVQPNHHLQQNQQQQINCFTTSHNTTSTSNNTLGTGNITQSYIKDPDGGGAAELEDQDIEEVFKVLKGFEGGTTSDLNVCDLNVLFNEVYMKINETELGGTTGSGGGSIVSTISTNTQNTVAVSNPSIQLVKPTEVEEGQIEIEKRQQQMQKKTDFLMRRLRKLQTRYMCKHTSEEIAGLFEWSARQTSKGHTDTATLHSNENFGAEGVIQDPSKCFLKVIAARPPASIWKDVHESLLPANQISTLLRKIESVANAQQLCTTPSISLVNITHKKTKKASAVVATSSNSSGLNSLAYGEGKAEEVVVATLEESVTDELTQVAGLLQSEMSEVQKSIDSDATESSSGGESADEMVTYNNTQQQTLPITKRAAWRYSRDRAAIASRWSWLLSQISDLEIKIRQHSELHQEIVRSKGLVTCGGQLESDYNVNNSSGEQGIEEGSCRSRGYIPSLFRKRKLIQTTNIHTISKKAARPSTIKCGCQWPLHPCALCTGRSDPTAPRDLPDTMMISDRIALLDSGYHPVLSFRENVNNALHFEAIAKQPEWQQRVMRCQAKNIAKNVWRAEREAVAAAAGGHHSSFSKKYEAPPTKRRYIKKKDRLNNEDKVGSGKSNYSTTGNPQTQAPNFQITTKSSISTTSLNDVGNGTSTLSTTTSATPLVANRGMAKSAKKSHCLVVGDGIIKEPANSPQLTCMTNVSLTASAASTLPTTTIINNRFIHQTSDCLLTNFDQFNSNQIPSSVISNTNNHNNSSKSNKYRKLSSSTTANSHHYSHLNNSNNILYNGDSSYMLLGHESWGGASENFNIRSRTSSPTHGSTGIVYPKYERSLDRKNRTSYDIDNIVIPYSVAAATRVEILPYKEIPTPKWRVIENEGDEINTFKILSNLKTHNDTSELKPITNGHICDNDENLCAIKSEQMDDNKEKNDKIRAKSLESTEIKFNYSIDTEKILKNPKVCTNLDNKKFSNYKEVGYENSIGKTDNINEGKLEEPILRKIKVKSVMINDKKDEVEREEEGDEEELTKEMVHGEFVLQSSLKASIEEDEDISDDAMFLRHERALTEERRKFQTYLKFPWSTRSRANRRIDSRAESSGANTPDPSSPAPQTPSMGGGDQESIPSPVNPATPLNSLDIISEAGDVSTSFLGVGPLPSLSSKRYERRRTTSTKKDREVERRSSTPDSKELIPPYDPLTFPLTDEQFEELLRAMPSDHSEDSKRFDECYFPGGNSIGLGGILSSKFPRNVNSKRTSRTSTCGESMATTNINNRRVKSFNKNLRPISADDSHVALSHENGDMLLYDEEYDDDYPKHHLAPNDDHLTADSVRDGNEEDVYRDQYDAYVGSRQRKHRDIEGESSEEEPFQDDDPNDPEWRGESEERLRKKV